MQIMGPREYRVKRKMTTAEFALLLGVSQGHVSNLENGNRKPSASVAEHYHIMSKGRVRLQDFPAMGSK